MKIYVGNVSHGTTEDTIRETFEQYGEVESIRFILDRDTKQRRGFCFVDMPNDEQAQQAITALNDKELEGRKLRVNEARELDRPARPGGFGDRSSRPPRNGGGNGGGGFKSRF